MSGPQNSAAPDDSMLELFRAETERQTGTMTAGLLELERNPGAIAQLESLMRAAHSMKGAARIIGLAKAVKVAHAMEDCFEAAQRGKLRLGKAEVDVLLHGVDLLSQLAKCAPAELQTWSDANAGEPETFLAAVAAIMQRAQQESMPATLQPSAVGGAPGAAGTAGQIEHAEPSGATPVGPEIRHRAVTKKPAAYTMQKRESTDQVVRVSAENLSRVLGLAGAWLAECSRLHPFTRSMFDLKRMHTDAVRLLGELRRSLFHDQLPEHARAQLHELSSQLERCNELLSTRLEQIDMYDRNCARLSHRLYEQALKTRMRPFSDAVSRFSRMVRDLAHELGKLVRLEITGEKTLADREVLERLETPLGHLVRNAIDHGCQPPTERQRAGKPVENLIRIEAAHTAGMLVVTVSDDGAGIDLASLRSKLVERKLCTAQAAAQLTEAELLEFVFLPGFSTKDGVTEISGRGVGLDLVKSMVRSLHGTIRVWTKPGEGTTFMLQLPLTLSVVRALLVEIGSEPYAFGLGQVECTTTVERAKIKTVQGHEYFELNGRFVALIPAGQLFGYANGPAQDPTLSVVVIGRAHPEFGLVVERFLGEGELVVQPLDQRLGRVHCISAGAVMTDGSPVLLVDVEELLQLLAGQGVGHHLVRGGPGAPVHSRDSQPAG